MEHKVVVSYLSSGDMCITCETCGASIIRSRFISQRKGWAQKEYSFRLSHPTAELESAGAND